MDSANSNVDLELIAALIDGRLAGEDRARAMKLLADSDEALELYAQAWRQREETPDVKVVPLGSRLRWRQWKLVVPIALAAGLAIVVVPKLSNRGAPAASAREYAMALSQDPRFVNGLRDGWDQRGWAVTRGGGSLAGTTGSQQARTAPESGPAFRLGVRSVDLQVALQKGDMALAGRLIGEMLETLDAVALSAPVAEKYAELRSSLATGTRDQAIDRASDAEHALRDHLGSASFEFGQWAGAAELAARMHDPSFFASSQGMRFIQSNASITGVDSAAIRSIDARMKQGLTDPALDDVREILRGIIQRRGS